jgi:hypothetical protein
MYDDNNADNVIVDKNEEGKKEEDKKSVETVDGWEFFQTLRQIISDGQKEYYQKDTIKYELVDILLGNYYSSFYLAVCKTFDRIDGYYELPKEMLMSCCKILIFELKKVFEREYRFPVKGFNSFEDAFQTILVTSVLTTLLRFKYFKDI